MATKYNWLITVQKFAWSLAEIMVAGAIVVFTEDPKYLVLVPLAEAVKNWIKHRN